MQPTSSSESVAAAQVWPDDVEMVMSALSSGDGGAAPGRAGVERRSVRRAPYRARGELRLVSDSPAASRRELFARDATLRSLRFITRDRLAIGETAFLSLPHPSEGRSLIVRATVVRCTRLTRDWYDAAVRFERDHIAFA